MAFREKFFGQYWDDAVIICKERIASQAANRMDFMCMYGKRMQTNGTAQYLRWVKWFTVANDGSYS